MAKAKSATGTSKEPRLLTTEERREMFLKRKKELAKDWRVLQTNAVEELVPFNRLPLDHGLKLYGLARQGTVYQLHGDEGSAKTSIVIDIMNNYMQTTGEPAAYFDFERRLKSLYLRAQGFDEDMAYVDRPDSIEDATKKALDLMKQGVRLFAFDSIPRMRNMVSEEDIKSGAAFKTQPGTHARAIQQFYDIILPHIARVDGTLLMINQTRSRIEMTQEAQSAAKGYATVTNLNYSLPGGRANRYNISVMIENKLVRAWKPGKHEDEFAFESESKDDYVCLEIRHRTLKNTISGTGYRQSASFIRPGLGVDDNIATRLLARENKVIAWSGKYYFAGESIDNPIVVFDSKADAIKRLVIDEDEELLAKIKQVTAARMSQSAEAGKIEVTEEEQRYYAGEQNDPDDDNEGAASVGMTVEPIEGDEL